MKAVLETGDSLAKAARVKFALRRLARRYQGLAREIGDYDVELAALATRAAPTLLAVNGVGPETAARLLAAVGDNPERLRSEVAFAHLCGAAPHCCPPPPADGTATG